MMKRGIAAAVVLLLSGVTIGTAQELDVPGVPDFGDFGLEPPARSSGVFHGNYCGVGDNGPGLPPVDALDRACMHHDACTPAGGIPSCACNARFRRETHAVVTNRLQPNDLRALAGVVEASIRVIPCRP